MVFLLAPTVPSAVADCAFAHGVFEHLDADEMLWFLTDMHRILKPGGIVAFNFDSLTESESVQRLRKSAVINIWVDPREYAPGTKNQTMYK